MRVSLRARQTAAVTLLIALAMTVLSVQHLANLARVGLEDSRSIGELLGRMIYQRAREAIAGGGDPVVALRTDQGIRSILESTAAYGRNVTYAAVVDNDGIAIAHSFPAIEGQKLEPGENLSAVLDGGHGDAGPDDVRRSQPRGGAAAPARRIALRRDSRRPLAGAHPQRSRAGAPADALDDAARLERGASGGVGAGRAHPAAHSRHQYGPDEARPRREGRQHRSAAGRGARGRRRIVQGHQREARVAIARAADGGRDARGSKSTERDDDSSRSWSASTVAPAAELARAVGAVLGLDGGRGRSPEFEVRASTSTSSRPRSSGSTKSSPGSSGSSVRKSCSFSR